MLASIYRPFRLGALFALRAGGIFNRMRDSNWRHQRLLILCYHGVSLEEEHLWRPALYVNPQLFESRLETLARGGYSVLPLKDAIQCLYQRDLPPRSVVLTFDDGTSDFYQTALPKLKQYGFPATVYQTTYYCDHDRPIFHLVCSYILWKRRGEVLNVGKRFGLPALMDLRTEGSRQAILDQLVANSKAQNFSEHEKNQVAKELAEALAIDYSGLVKKRVLQLMRSHEIAELASHGIDFQLHTHRHRTPFDAALFSREIRDNRRSLEAMIPNESFTHFCYPSGVYRQEFVPWLIAQGVVSATTCDPGLASPDSNPLLLPRFIDSSYCTQLEFEAWLTGAASLIPRRRTHASVQSARNPEPARSYASMQK